MKIHVTNPGPNTMYIGSTMIPAGEGREVEASEVPDHLLPKAPAAAPAPDPHAGETDEERTAREIAEAAAKRREELAEILTHKVGDIREQFSTFSDEDLATLAELEGAKESTLGIGGPRKTLLEAIAEEQMQRAGSR